MTSGNGNTIGFAIDVPAQVHAWCDAVIGHGGPTIENPPGVRESMIADLYLAYLGDPDGNKLCALHQVPTVERSRRGLAG